MYLFIYSTVQEIGQFRADQLFSHQTLVKWPLIGCRLNKLIILNNKIYPNFICQYPSYPSFNIAKHLSTWSQSSNHSGKAARTELKKSSFSFVRSKLYLQPRKKYLIKASSMRKIEGFNIYILWRLSMLSIELTGSYPLKMRLLSQPFFNSSNIGIWRYNKKV